MRIAANPLVLPPGRYPASLTPYLSRRAAADALREIASWPGYASTPLIDLPDMAAASGVARIAYKDESGRFGLGSFKALGGAYAVTRIVRERPGGADGLTVCCATDGNHGRSVAWRAQQLNVRCVIYLHEGVSEGRERAIAAFGAEVRRVPGNYDESVRVAERDAKAHGWTVVSDTSYPGYRQIPCAVMQGYSVMIEEILETGFVPTHVFVQGGVGGLAAAACAHFWETLGADAPRIVIVEPDTADCLFRSAVAGRPIGVEGHLDTLMAGLACGEVSEIAWEIVSKGVGHFVTIPDAMAVDAMRLLSSGGRGFPPIVAGESATAGLAAFLEIAKDERFRREIGIKADSRILCYGTEGDTDPALYERLVGQSGQQVRAGRP